MPNTATDVILYDYANSTAAYRVRIALQLKGLAFRSVRVNLLAREHRDDAYLDRNSQGLVPMLSIDGLDLTQSLAIIDYLDRREPSPPILPDNPAQRASTLADALVIIADIHPVNNLRVWQYLKDPLGHDQVDVVRWMHHWMALGFDALEQRAPEHGLFGGEPANLVNICLVAQMHNARRFALDLGPYPKLVRIADALGDHPAYIASHPAKAFPDP